MDKDEIIEDLKSEIEKLAIEIEKLIDLIRESNSLNDLKYRLNEALEKKESEVECG